MAPKTPKTPKFGVMLATQEASYNVYSRNAEGFFAFGMSLDLARDTLKGMGYSEDPTANISETWTNSDTGDVARIVFA